MPLSESELIHDWNRAAGEELRPVRGRVELNDETLRDGLQSPSVRSPAIGDKLRILHLIAELGIESADLGLPGAGPRVGRAAFRTATGVHAAAIIKARRKGDDWLADRIYSGVPASLVGHRQEIEVGPMSGRSNVVCWLRDRGLEPADELVDAMFARAKAASSVLEEEEEIRGICAGFAVAGRDA